MHRDKTDLAKRLSLYGCDDDDDDDDNDYDDDDDDDDDGDDDDNDDNDNDPTMIVRMMRLTRPRSSGGRRLFNMDDLIW